MTDTPEQHSSLIALNPRCPRCGYDVRAVIDTWTDRCPMTGQCTECGLEFVWSEVLHPEKYEPQWCVEFVTKRRHLPIAALKTWLRSFWPWGFFARLSMTMSVRSFRLGLYVAILFAPLLLTYVGVQTYVACRVRFLFERESNLQVQQRAAFLRTWMQTTEFKQSSTTDKTQMMQHYQMLATSAQNGVTISHSYFDAAFEAVVFPLREKSTGTVGLVGAGYLAPRGLYEMLRRYNQRAGAPWAGFRPSTPAVDLQSSAWFGVAGLWVWLMMPISFVLLPLSRRRAKVRWSHIVRVSAYAALVPSLLGALCVIGAALVVLTDSAVSVVAGQAASITIHWVMIPMTIVWWAMAINRYLCIPRGWLVAPVLAFLAIVVFLGLCYLIIPDLLLEHWLIYG